MSRGTCGEATAALREGFLLTRPRALTWTTGGRHYVDDVAVSARVYELAAAGDLTAARAAWLEEWDAAAVGRTA